MFSIIVCSHHPERAAFIRNHYETLFRGFDHEIIAIDDARSLCEGYTRGFERSRGDLLIFSHDDVEFIAPDVAARVREHLRHFDLIGIAGTTRLIDGMWLSAGDPHCFMLVLYPEPGGQYSVRFAGKGPLVVPNIQAVDGCFMACQREVVETIGFDVETFDGFHLYDLDFSFRAHKSGFEVAVCRDIPLIHLSQGVPDEVWQKYRERFEAKHREALGGPAGTMQVVGTLGTKEDLARVCRPENLLSAVRWA